MPANYLTRDQHGMYAGEAGGPGPTLMGADTLMGNRVCNRDGEDLGHVREIMIDMATGRVDYAVLSFATALGQGDQLFAVPWAALALDTGNKRFTLDVAKARLGEAPGFDKAQWPWMDDPQWIGDLHRFYGTAPQPA